jgi:hypothetical protein
MFFRSEYRIRVTDFARFPGACPAKTRSGLDITADCAHCLQVPFSFVTHNETMRTLSLVT